MLAARTESIREPNWYTTILAGETGLITGQFVDGRFASGVLADVMAVCQWNVAHRLSSLIFEQRMLVRH